MSEPRRPTPIMIGTLKELVESGGTKPVSTAMVDAGASPAYAKNPQKLMRSKTFKQIYDAAFPSDSLKQKHKDLLGHVRVEHQVFPSTEDDEIITEIIESIPGSKLIKIRLQGSYKRAYFWIPDGHVQLEALDKMYKIKGSYAPEKHLHSMESPYETMTDQEITERREALRQEIARRRQQPTPITETQNTPENGK